MPRFEKTAVQNVEINMDNFTSEMVELYKLKRLLFILETNFNVVDTTSKAQKKNGTFRLSDVVRKENDSEYVNIDYVFYKTGAARRIRKNRWGGTYATLLAEDTKENRDKKLSDRIKDVFLNIVYRQNFVELYNYVNNEDFWLEFFEESNKDMKDYLNIRTRF